MIPTLTDEAVGRLPLEQGRAALLEEILREAPAARTRTPRRWVAPLAAAAVVAGIAGAAGVAAGTGWWPGPDPSAPQAASSGGHAPEDEVVLDAPGWKVDSLGGDGTMFRNGDAQLEVTSYDADSYDSYVTDREHIVDPPAPGTPVEVLGRPGQLWAYSADDHTVIREVEDGHWLELRGSGLSQADFLALLGQLRFASQQEFEAALPKDMVTEAERMPAALEIIGGITAASGADFPSGQSLSLPDGPAEDSYQFGVEVVGAYACAWLEEYENATTHGQQGKADEALRVLGTSRQWPVLTEMDAEGDYPDVLWQIADEAEAGALQPWYREGLGC